MLKRFLPDRKDESLQRQIDAVLNEMQLKGVFHEDYPKLMTHLERLYEIKEKSQRPRLSWDTLVIVGGNLIGVLLIVAYEQKHVMSSKALAERIRPKHTQAN